MEVPVEPALTTKRASYVVNEESPDRPTATAVNMDADSPDAGRIGVQARLDQFRDFVSRSCCSCVAKMPAIMLVIAICLVVALLLALIPAIFVLTNAVSGESQAQVSSGFDTPVIRGGFKKPEHDDDLDDAEDLPGTVYGIPMTSFLPPNVSMCHGFGFACTNDPSIVISTNRRCDGIRDCLDDSDEINCNECQSAASCPFGESSEFRICLSPSHLCDGVGHCPNGYDEEALCKSSECEAEQLQCKAKNGAHMCLPVSARCDGVVDCRDGSDEKDCSACVRGAKMCNATSECIAARDVCDGVSQCLDGSDEAGCDCRSCSGSSQAVCGDGTCIEEWRVCDGFSDCPDGLDEVDCPGRCLLEEDSQPRETVICSNGRTYLKSEACSGEVAECSNACDECAPEAFTCSDNNKCIARRKLCDGHRDCLNGEDEENCGCREDMFQCQDKCVPKERLCDGVYDCVDKTDERNCVTCPESSFRCEADQTCHPASSRCDGDANCSDGADEKGCSCHECIGLHSQTYMCGSGSRCLRRSEVCAPYSMCPNATMADKAYCAALAFRARF